MYDSFVKVWVKPRAVVLDAADGTGERTPAILEHIQPSKVIALDASEAMLEVARSKIDDPRVEFKQGDLNQLPFEVNTFDLVSCTWAIEIMADPTVAVREFLRVIKLIGVVVYAFCSLPEGMPGKVLKYVIDKVSSKNSPLTHLLSEGERPFHHCEHCSLVQFTGGLTSVAMLSKCYQVEVEKGIYLPHSNFRNRSF